ncbi:probable GCY1 - galactose-induced protein of aldo/keto reductase family [Melanopsichium pennsylvanicum]|uniref:Probable GCY1 - galactose-induced protein of aldo/keto reductase family n=2 Tax=Melanopsichium pennsylvanicum TaxID=63383 RepID=A0AAJ5C402_9BASI|nr:probable GCY1-galactose-induced protein of aldo/keto reductase family [Melanopsichium pennsylvanicum 4]SNX83117.1 probable GCY1 - galactose-induced protein of aldo/keto reductase family [Melanopsichium pennsylvanicum]
MAEIPQFKLNTGAHIPSVGMGCWQGQPGAGADNELVDALKKAISVGYRHLDTATGYQNEVEVGQAVRESGVPRSELFVTTKLRPGGVHDVVKEFQDSFNKLNVEYIDLWLLHWPQGFTSSEGGFGSGESFGLEHQKHLGPTFNETWAKMEDIFLNSHKGKVKAIGDSNFSIKTLEILLKTAKVVPAVNQVETHPYLPDQKLVDYCKSKGIHVTAYSPLGQTSKEIHEDKDLNEIAKKYNTTAANVALSWNVQRGVSVAPKSTNENRMKQNITLLKLTDDESKRVDNISNDPKKHTRTNYLVLNKEKQTVLGWTFDEMGWDVGFPKIK